MRCVGEILSFMNVKLVARTVAMVLLTQYTLPLNWEVGLIAYLSRVVI